MRRNPIHDYEQIKNKPIKTSRIKEYKRIEQKIIETTRIEQYLKFQLENLEINKIELYKSAIVNEKNIYLENLKQKKSQ